MADIVYLECVKDGSKLRVRIISRGFHNDLNCQFPRAIRKEGRKYSVPHYAVDLIEKANAKFFYRIDKNCITIIEHIDVSTTIPAKIFEDASTQECIVCLAGIKDIIFANCGHYVCCTDCATRIFISNKKCPMCRASIYALVTKDQIDF